MEINMNKTEEKTVSIYIPKRDRTDNELFISVNGESMVVKTGQTVELPERFAKVVENSLKMQERVDAYIDANRTDI